MNATVSDSKPGLDSRSRELRALIVRALIGGNRGHLGSSMSLVEILRVLFDDHLRFKPDQPDWKERDRFVLSKGHGCLALYALLADKGFITHEALDSFCHSTGILGGHPDAAKVPGVEASTGALGHGLPIAVGMALAARIRHQPHRVVVVTGDGEINEGSNWEAAMSAANHRLDSLSVFIDYNKLQSYGTTSEVCDLEPLADKWRSFGFAVREIDGHDVPALRSCVRTLPFEPDKPSAVICHTIKGRGFDFAEGQAAWHHKSHFSAKDIARMHAALEAN
jgi:transketolase